MEWAVHRGAARDVVEHGIVRSTISKDSCSIAWWAGSWCCGRSTFLDFELAVVGFDLEASASMKMPWTLAATS